ncbi:MAG: DUF58 domain-containing protein [Bacteroidetes bacterium]|nr:DUF58 domain-containing protein [Bacteroidota bacterium]
MKNISDIQQFQQFGNLEFIARQVVEGFITGLHRSPYHGFSVEFAEHRLYNKGESTKHIDWKLFARTEKLFVKKFEEETNLRSHILIDASSSMLFPFDEKETQTKLAFSAYCAAALIFLLRKQRDAVGLTLFSDEIELHTASRLSTVHSKMLFAELEILLKPDVKRMKRETLASKMLHQIAENIHKRSLVIIFSDMMDSESTEDLFSALQHLRYNKHEVILFHVTDKRRETMFEYMNRPYKFIDLETGEDVKFSPNEIRNEYKRSIKKYHDEIRTKCGQYQIDLITADVKDDFADVLLPYLIKRRQLF